MSFFRFFSLVHIHARMALKSEASKFFLSYFWWVLEPLLFVLMFYVVFELLLGRGRSDFLLFLVCGKIPFLWFAKSVITSSSSIVQNKGLINQVDMPKALFPYSSVHQALYKQWAVFLVLFGVVIFYGHWPEPNWLWLIPVVIVQYFLILVCSLFGSLCVSYVGDLKMVISMGITFLMFSSGVFWDINAIVDPHTRGLLLTFNPVAFLLDAYRQVLMESSLYNLKHLSTLGAVLGAALFILHVVYNRASKKIAAKLMNS